MVLLSISRCSVVSTLWFLLPALVKAHEVTGRPGHGFIGYGITMYIPACAYACHDSISAPLNCSDADMGDMSMPMRRKKRMDMGGASTSDGGLAEGDGWMVMGPPPGACMCHNDFFLQTLAYCMSTRCAAYNVSVPDLEDYWLHNIPGRELVQAEPKVTYQQALANITSTPTTPLNNSVLLNYTAIVPDDLWLSTYNALMIFEQGEDYHERFGLVVFLSGAVIPIGVSILVRLIPWPSSLLSKVYAYAIDPPVIGTRHSSPGFGGLIVPTRGQALFIAYIWLINIVLSAVQYNPLQPNSWFSSTKWEVLTYIANRSGVLSFANLPLVVLYAGRNNVLLWLTNWSHSTFLLLHRWIAFICALQAVLHSLLYLYIYSNQDGYDYSSESKLPYWYWGIIGTLSLVVIIPASSLQIRQKLYNHVFLPSHVIIAMFALVGCYLHITFRFSFQWGYETWIFMAAAVWAFDRLARMLRIVNAMISGRTFFGRAFVYVIDDEYYRLDLVPGLPGSEEGYVYLHFPTVTKWRFWESHPFSVPGISSCEVPNSNQPLGARSEPRGKQDTHQVHLKETQVDSNSVSDIAASPEDGDGSSGQRAVSPLAVKEASASIVVASSTEKTTLFVRRTVTGLTSLLVSHAAAAASSGLPVLVEPSYGKAVTFLQAGQPGSQFHPSEKYPNILCIAGGVGISAIVPVLKAASSFATATNVGSKKVYWGVRSLGLVRAVENMIGCDTDDWDGTVGEKGFGVLERKWSTDVQAVVSYGQRMILREILQQELARSGHNHCKGTTVVACGPPAMADDVRCIVAGLARDGALVRLIVEDFSW